MPQMAGLTEADLSVRAGTTTEQIRRVVAVGIVAPDEQGLFRAGDIQRVRLAEAFERSGISLESIGQAIASGHLSFSFVDLLFPEVMAYTGKTYGQMCEEYGFTQGLVETIHEAAGLPRPSMDDPVREDDQTMFPIGQFVMGMGMDEASIARVLRVYGENLRRMAQAEPYFYHTYVEGPLLHSGMAEQQMRDLATQMNPQITAMVERLVMWLYRRHQEHYTTEHLIEHVENALEEMGVAQRRPAMPSAMVFLDLAGYTRITEERGDEAAAELAARLAELVHGAAMAHGGQPVKWLGDGVMFHFPDPGEAVRCSLAMVERATSAGLPPAHVGVNAGPVIVRDGDYFGRTVNVAARIAGRAGPGQVLVSQEVVEAGSPHDVRFSAIGPQSLKGLSRAVHLYLARWAHRPEALIVVDSAEESQGSSVAPG